MCSTAFILASYKKVILIHQTEKIDTEKEREKEKIYDGTCEAKTMYRYLDLHTIVVELL